MQNPIDYNILQDGWYNIIVDEPLKRWRKWKYTIRFKYKKWVYNSKP